MERRGATIQEEETIAHSKSVGGRWVCESDLGNKGSLLFVEFRNYQAVFENEGYDDDPSSLNATRH